MMHSNRFIPVYVLRSLLLLSAFSILPNRPVALKQAQQQYQNTLAEVSKNELSTFREQRYYNYFLSLTSFEYHLAPYKINLARANSKQSNAALEKMI
ncbi:hypothetical protein FHS86_001976 [Roseimarinus sediminis]